MPNPPPREVIAVRSLTVSDLGLFVAQRQGLPSRQRAINVNARIARVLLSRRLFEAGGGDFRCVSRFGEAVLDEIRPLRISGKNWRLSGARITDPAFALLDSKDFVLIRTVEENDGGHPLDVTFFSRSNDLVMQAGLASVVERSLGQSMALFREKDGLFPFLAQHCPATAAPLVARPGAAAFRTGSDHHVR